MAIESLNQQAFNKLISRPRHDYIILISREIEQILPLSINWKCPPLVEFISNVVSSSCVPISTLLATPVYIKRLRLKLSPKPRVIGSTGHCVFFSCLILAAKYLNDVAPKNNHWSWWSYMIWQNTYFGFNQFEVNLMERQLLQMLDWDIRITDLDIYNAFKAPLLLWRSITQNSRQNPHRKMDETLFGSISCPCRICRTKVARISGEG